MAQASGRTRDSSPEKSQKGKGALAVVGAGAWGTALAKVASRDSRSIDLWVYEANLVNAINEKHENLVFLPGVALPESIRATSNLADVARADILFLAMPAQYMRAVLQSLKKDLRPETILVICAKGIEQKTGALMSDIIRAECASSPLAVLSGPSFATEVANSLPTALTLAVERESVGETIIGMIGTQSFRLYVSHDIIGAQIGGAVKNVLAIACGIVDGRRFGENARAALITRGFAEMTRLGLAMGGRAETLSGLCGLGDLVLTCASRTSRNMALGAALGEGRSLQQLLTNRSSVAEGVFSAEAVAFLAKRHGVEMPIAAAVAAIMAGELSVEEAISNLLSRPFKYEN